MIFLFLMEDNRGGARENNQSGFQASKYFEASRELVLAKTSDELLEKLLIKLDELLAPQVAAFLLRESASYDLKFIKIRGAKEDNLLNRVIRKGEGLCGLAAETNQNLILLDCNRDPRFNPEVDHLPGVEVISLIIVPFRIEKKVFGLVALFNKKNESPFNLEEFKLVLSYVNLAELALERLVLLKQLAEREVYDPLTGVYNLKTFVEYLQREITRSERYGLDLSLLRVDIDYYEKIIQTFGQEAGQRVLTNLAFTIKKITRKVDLVARTGEDEFMVLLPNTSREGAQKLRQRILKVLENQNLRSTGIPYTVSIDLQAEKGTTAPALLKVAEVVACLEMADRRHQRRKYPTPGEELEEAVVSALFLREK